MPQTQSIAWPDDLYKRIKDREKADGDKFSDVVRTAVEVYLGFDPYFWKIIMGYSERHQLPSHLIIQNMLIKRFAEEAAEDEFHGEPQPRELMEFTHTAEGFLTGGALFDWLKDDVFYYQMGKRKLRTSKKKRQKMVKAKDQDRSLLL